MDNTTAHISSEYDNKIHGTIPQYDSFHKQTIAFVRDSLTVPPTKWLDTGCGTATLVSQAIAVFPETEFFLCDPSDQMIAIAREKLGGAKNVTFLPNTGSADITLPENTFDVITAIQSHHYLDCAGRADAIRNCYRLLKPGGTFITFENIRPMSQRGTELGLRRWAAFQMQCGKPQPEAEKHVQRFDQEFFPITIPQHIALLHEACGFEAVEILWASYMQCGFYAIK